MMYTSLLKLFQSGDFDLLRKGVSIICFFKRTEYQSKFELLLANTKGRLQGIDQWEKELSIIKMKYSGTLRQRWLRNN